MAQLLLSRIRSVLHPLERIVILSADFVGCQVFELLHGFQGGQVHLPCLTGHMGILWCLHAQGVRLANWLRFDQFFCYTWPVFNRL